MAKRGRKPGKERKGYWYEVEEEAFITYVTSKDENEKKRVFDTVLRPAFTKMTESIIRRYNLYPPDESFQETFDDAMSFLMTKIEHFNPESGYKSYSYAGTIIKNYLIYKINQFTKNQKRNTSYDAYNTEELTSITDALKYSYNSSSTSVPFLTELMKKTADSIENTIIKDNGPKPLTEDQKKVGNALIFLLRNWEDLFAKTGSDKFNKSSILFFLREYCNMETKKIRVAMKQYKDLYYLLKGDMVQNGY